MATNTKTKQLFDGSEDQSIGGSVGALSPTRNHRKTSTMKNPELQVVGTLVEIASEWQCIASAMGTSAFERRGVLSHSFNVYKTDGHRHEDEVLDEVAYLVQELLDGFKNQSILGGGFTASSPNYRDSRSVGTRRIRNHLFVNLEGW
ncbi:hypothetical protein EDB89DRAFT_1906746 [Lactarius sanguifluus]|nr:hypothetical protein EDB89DRAFT_1906746 [Lactarius sanguifluus]